MAIINYLLRRAIRHWQLFLNLSLGVVLATVLLANTPLLVDTVLEIGLRHEILSADAADRNLRLQAYASAEPLAVEELDAQVRARLGRWLGDRLGEVTLSVDSNSVIPWVDGEPLSGDRLTLSFHDGIGDHVEFVAGAWPMEVSVPTDTLPVVVGEALARAYRLDVGDRLPISFKKDDVQPCGWLEVVGIIRPLDANDAYWSSEVNPLRAQSDRQWSASYSTLLPVDSFFRSVTALFPGAGVRATWNVQLAPGKLSLADLPQLLGQIDTLKRDLYRSEQHFLFVSGLGELLASFAGQAEAVRGPLFLLMIEIALLVLYYVVMMAALSVQQAEREFAILRSRGASGWHILTIQATEAVLVVAVALLSGPGLATVLLRAITVFGPLTDVTPAGWSVHLTQESWFAATIGAVVCIVGLLLPVGPTLRRSIVTHQQALTRPPRAAWWQRLYLDVILLVAGLVLLARLHLYGGIVAGGASRPQVDWLLLLSPLALLLGSATILLRVLPPILQVFASVTARGRGLPASLAMWQVSRNPVQVVLLVLLLTLAMALGMLSTGLNATLDASERERASYAVGGDLRFASDYSVDLSSLADEPGVRTVTSVARDLGTLDLRSYRSFPRFEILAVDPYPLAAVGTFRDDFSDGPIEELLGRIVPDEDPTETALALPGHPASIGVWMWSPKDQNRSDQKHASGFYAGESDLDRIVLSAKLLTAQSEFFSVDLTPSGPEACPYACCTGCCPIERAVKAGELDPCEWRYFSAELPGLTAGSYPLALRSIWIESRARNVLWSYRADCTMDLAIDDVTVIDGETGRVQVPADFEDETVIWQLNRASSQATRDTNTAYAGKASQRLALDFEHPIESVVFKLAPTHPEGELPILVSPAFLEVAHLAVGDTASVYVHSAVIPVRLVGELHYFPTLYENYLKEPVPLEAGFVVASRDALLARVNDANLQPFNANEVWLSTDGQVSAGKVAMVVPAVDRVWELEAVRSAIKADPMALGLRSVTFYGFVLTSLLSVVGFVTHFYMNARRRESTYGILRAMGLSPWQLYASLVIEQTILIGSGLALGTLLGAILNSLVLPGLPITLGRLPPIPPFRPYAGWSAVGGLYAVLGSALLVCLGTATILLWRAQLHRVLRIGEE